MFWGILFLSTRKGVSLMHIHTQLISANTGRAAFRRTIFHCTLRPRFFDITGKSGLIIFVFVAGPGNAESIFEAHSHYFPDRRFHGEFRVVFHSQLHPARGRTARARILRRALPLAQRRACGPHPDGILPGVRQRGTPKTLRLLLVRSQTASLR